MNVKLRQRKSLKTGRVSLYIEVYKGYSKDNSGKIKHHRDFEYLQYFLYDDPKTPSEKQHNKDNLKGAEAVAAKRLLEIQNGHYGFATDSKTKTNFIEYFRTLTKQRFRSQGNYGNWDSALKHLENYCSASTTFKDIDAKFSEGFKDYLLNKAKMKTGKSLAINSALSYFNKFRAAINQAIDDGIITNSPIKNVKGIKQAQSERKYLTFDEIRALAKTECRSEVLKRAFLFSCLTGLRWSDINKLTWSEVQEFNGKWKVQFTQQKTKSVEYLDIADQAKNYLGEKGELDKRVFVGLKYSAHMNLMISQWMLKAGITKQITFHCARHTFATLQLTLGTDIYTVSKLLGHGELKTTQIYAKIIDQKKQEAVSRIPNLLD